MNLSSLFESATDDVNADDIVNRTAYQFINAVYDKVPFETTSFSRYPHYTGEYLIQKGYAIAPYFRNVLFVFLKSNGGSAAASVSWDKEIQVFRVRIYVPSLDVDTIASSVVTTRMATIIKHELHHILDIGRSPNGIDEPSNDYDADKLSGYNANDAEWARYYNSPTEYNSYFYGAADSLINRIRDLRTEPEALDLYEPLPVAFQKALTEIIRFAGPSEKKAYANLNPTMKKHFIRRMYKLFALLRDEAKEKGVEDKAFHTQKDQAATA